ncbi:unnamed protein product [Chironomus riparius]|uniref:Regulator of telomere elongation helicase 1 homolog n=1 Tax=Chironomus riparius TaxID=315576 RepID=A0A9N9WUI2_9DIPT|nr:unnamed protein product [Chironomus riparius]
MIIEIEGIKIDFPFEPYALQKDYMTKVIQALQSQQNAVLESPTGTGKTLCLLTSSLAWLLQQKNQMMSREKANLNFQAGEVMKNMKGLGFNPEDVTALIDPSTDGRQWRASTIIYTSRTHSQLTQAMRELKNSDYKDVNSVALGSRDQLCINPEVLEEGKSGTERNTMCQLKVKKRQCKFRERVDKCTSNPEVTNMPIKDIEDLVTIGKKCTACPYYLSRDLAANADIIFMPYNYLLDPRILKGFKINLIDSVVILDEAHNVEKVCEESASIQFASSDITNCINDIAHVMKMLNKEEDIMEFVDDEDVEKDFTLEDLAKLQDIMLTLEKEVDKIDSVFVKQGRTFPGSKIFDIFRAASIDQISYPMIRKLIDSLSVFLTQSSAGNLFGRKGGGLLKIMQVLEVAFDGCGDVDFNQYLKDMDRGYRVHVEIEIERKKNDSGGWISQAKLTGNPKVINYWCFNPGFGMANLLRRQVRTVILTSGTLAPLKPLISELAINIDHRLENPHIIKSNQVMVKIINAGPDKEPLCGTYDNRDNPKYIKSMGMTILGISRVTPNGVLVFFPSYPMMNNCFEMWKNTGIWQSLYEIKPILMEPRGKDEFAERIGEYYDLVKLKKGAIFMAVLRGKISEGLDFNDHNARAVIICGIPFPPMMDPRVILKKKYLDINRNNVNQLQSGQEWYVLEAVRAVNQAIGRVIRHKDDYGAIFLCDRRFHQQKTQLSRWIQPHLMKQSVGDVNFGMIIGELARFFRNLSGSMPEPPVRQENKEIKKENVDSNGYLSTTVAGNKMMRQHIKIESSNEIYGTPSLPIQKSEEFTKYCEGMQQKIKTEPQGFMGSLNREVSVIDFNSTSIGESSSSSTSIKTARSFDFSQDSENASKKRRLKMIPNANQLYSEPQSSVLEQLRSTKVRVKRSDYDRQVSSEKKEFIGELKSTISIEGYKIYLATLYSYNKKDYTIEKALDKFVILFKTSPKAVAFLRNTRSFLREEDRPALDRAIENNFVID